MKGSIFPSIASVVLALGMGTAQVSAGIDDEVRLDRERTYAACDSLNGESLLSTCIAYKVMDAYEGGEVGAQCEEYLTDETGMVVGRGGVGIRAYSLSLLTRECEYVITVYDRGWWRKCEVVGQDTWESIIKDDRRKKKLHFPCPDEKYRLLDFHPPDGRIGFEDVLVIEKRSRIGSLLNVFVETGIGGQEAWWKTIVGDFDGLFRDDVRVDVVAGRSLSKYEYTSTLKHIWANLDM